MLWRVCALEFGFRRGLLGWYPLPRIMLLATAVVKFPGFAVHVT